MWNINLSLKHIRETLDSHEIGNSQKGSKSQHPNWYCNPCWPPTRMCIDFTVSVGYRIKLKQLTLFLFKFFDIFNSRDKITFATSVISINEGVKFSIKQAATAKRTSPNATRQWPLTPLSKCYCSDILHLWHWLVLCKARWIHLQSVISNVEIFLWSTHLRPL